MPGPILRNVTPHTHSQKAQFVFQPLHSIIAQHRWEFPALKHEDVIAGNLWRQQGGSEAQLWGLTWHLSWVCLTPGCSWITLEHQGGAEITTELHLSTVEPGHSCEHWLKLCNLPELPHQGRLSLLWASTTSVHDAKLSWNPGFIWITKHLPGQEHAGFSPPWDKFRNFHQYQASLWTKMQSDCCHSSSYWHSRFIPTQNLSLLLIYGLV